MYKYIKGEFNEVYTGIIDIVMYFDTEDSKIAANRLISQDNVPEEDRITNYQLSFYDDFIDTVRSIILQHFRKIICSEQSNQSYSYYIDVETNIDNPELSSKWQFRLRASNHVRPRHKNDSVYSKGETTGKLFRTIVIGKDQEFESYHQAILAINKICKNIAKGDFDVISKNFRNVTYSKKEYEDFLKTIQNIEEY